MNKKIFVMLVVLAIVGTAGAYQLGQILTQEQVNGIDFSTHNLGIEIGQITKGATAVRVPFTYDTLQRNADSTFTIVERASAVTYSLKQYYDCRTVDLNTANECRVKARKTVKAVIINQRERERARLENLKTQAIYDELGVNDLNIPSGELN